MLCGAYVTQNEHNAIIGNRDMNNYFIINIGIGNSQFPDNIKSPIVNIYTIFKALHNANTNIHL